jgi:hypothetical protein
LKAFIESRGFLVEKITRSAIGHITLKGLVPGAIRVLEKSQVEALLNQPELGTRLIEREQGKKPRFHATSEEDREKSRARARGDTPRLKKIRERQDEYREKLGVGPKKRPSSEQNADREETGSFERSERPSRRAAPSRERAPRGESSMRVKFSRPRRDDEGSEPRRSERSERGYGRASERSERGGFGRGTSERSERGGFGRGASERSERGFGRASERSERGGFGRGTSVRSERGSGRAPERSGRTPERRGPRMERSERPAGRSSFGDRARRAPRRSGRE